MFLVISICWDVGTTWHEHVKMTLLTKYSLTISIIPIQLLFVTDEEWIDRTRATDFVQIVQLRQIDTVIPVRSSPRTRRVVR